MELVLLFHLRTLRWCVKDLPARRYPVSALYGNLEPAATPAQVNDWLARPVLPNINDSVFHPMCGMYANPRQSLILDSTPWIPDSWYWIPVFVNGTEFQSLWDPDPLSCIQIPKPRVPDSASKNFPDSLTWGDVFLQCLSSRSF